MNDSIVSMKDVCFSYESESPVLCDVDLEIPRGKSGYIVGPNGGGKSTLLKLMLGLISQDSGEISILGTTPEKARLKIGYVPQYHQLDPSFPATAVEVVGTGLVGLGMSRSHRKDAIEAAMEELDIFDLRDRSFAGLSGGQRQRVLISRALVGAPEMLLLDEPTANIDPGAEEKFYATLAELTKRMSVLTVSHDLGFVIRESALVICVNRTVSIHHSSEFTAETANRIYRHEVNMIEHSHSCFCRCLETHHHESI